VQRVIARNTPTTLTHTFYDDAEAPAGATGPVLVSISRADGTALVDDAGTIAGDTGTYSYELAPQARLDVLHVSWSGTFSGTPRLEDDSVEIVGHHYASVAEIRNEGTGTDSPLTNLVKYPTARVEAARDQARALIERYCRVAFAPTYGSHVASGDGTDRLMLPDLLPSSFITATEDGQDADTSTWSLSPSGLLARTDRSTFSAASPSNVAVTYEHGHQVTPAEIRRAFLLYVRTLLLEDYSRTDDRVVTLTADGVLHNYARAGSNSPTGLPTVDAILNQYRLRQTLVA
jgi:hypothetical protein